MSESSFKAGDRVRFRFNGTEARESTVERVDPLATGTIVWVFDPDSPGDEAELYPCFAHEVEALS